MARLLNANKRMNWPRAVRNGSYPRRGDGTWLGVWAGRWAKWLRARELKLFYSLLAQPYGQAICLPLGMCKGDCLWPLKHEMWFHNAVQLTRDSAHVRDPPVTIWISQSYSRGSYRIICSTENPPVTRLWLCNSLLRLEELVSKVTRSVLR